MRALFTVFQQYSTTRTVVTPSSLSDTSNRDNKALGVEAVEFTNTPGKKNIPTKRLARFLVGYWTSYYVVCCAISLSAILFIGDFNITPASQIYEWLRRGQFDFSTMNDEAQKRISGISMSLNRRTILYSRFVFFIRSIFDANKQASR